MSEITPTYQTEPTTRAHIKRVKIEMVEYSFDCQCNAQLKTILADAEPFLLSYVSCGCGAVYKVELIDGEVKTERV